MTSSAGTEMDQNAMMHMHYAAYLLVHLDDRMLEEWCDCRKHAAMNVCYVKFACDCHNKSNSALPYPDILQHATWKEVYYN